MGQWRWRSLCWEPGWQQSSSCPSARSFRITSEPAGRIMTRRLATPCRRSACWLIWCRAQLAGLGAKTRDPRPPIPSPVSGRGGRSPAVVGVIAVVIGVLGVAVLGAALVSPGWGIALAARALRRWPELRDGFGSGAGAAEMLFSYQWRNLAVTAGLLVASGLVVWLGARGRWRFAGPIAAVLIVVDLFSFGIGFNTIADTTPLSYVPPSIQAIQADPGLFRIVTYGEDDTLPSNTNMLFGLQDVRGYDTIILRDYVEYLEQIEPQRGIPYSKVAKLFDQKSLSSPLLSLLNVKYVLTSKIVSQPGWSLF